MYDIRTDNRFEKLADIILDWNEKINVTAIRDRSEFMQKNVQDSLAVKGLLEFENASSVLDIGTGGGFPGLPLAIACPEKSFVLVDSIAKKLKVVSDAAEKLELGNVRVIHSRAEDLAAPGKKGGKGFGAAAEKTAKGKKGAKGSSGNGTNAAETISCAGGSVLCGKGSESGLADSGQNVYGSGVEPGRGRMDVVVSRAVANMSTLSEYCLPFVKVGGYFIAYKTENALAEIEAASGALKILGGRIARIVRADDQTVVDPANCADADANGHILVIVEKIKETPPKYPRGKGLPSSDPLQGRE